MVITCFWVATTKNFDFDCSISVHGRCTRGSGACVWAAPLIGKPCYKGTTGKQRTTDEYKILRIGLMLTLSSLPDWMTLALLTDEEIYGIGKLRHERNEKDLCILIQDSTDIDDVCYKKIHPINFNDKPYRCQICNKTFTDTCSISRHMKAHTKTKPYNRKICNKTFSGKGHLMDHIRVHTEEEAYIICNTKFSRKRNIGSRMGVHANEKPYSC
ncbi:zinc finger protein 778-like [Penaeus monodon]|uniref:zinc finger protein 778-like n=1 Tax=Penaeus monodon TaxID=6687 RepID=UPI0018A7AEB7|nr:zinc finger protein 778-like [Penaeus monodon]